MAKRTRLIDTLQEEEIQELKENQEKQLAKFVGLGFLSERVLNTLLKTTQKNGMKTATSYILEMQQKSSNKKKRKTTSFRI